jgi:hypothetical protein
MAVRVRTLTTDGATRFTTGENDSFTSSRLCGTRTAASSAIDGMAKTQATKSA